MVGSEEARQRRLQLLFFHQQVVGVVRGDGEDTHAGDGERLRQRGENAYLIEFQGSIDYQTSPAGLNLTRQPW
jgi:hypothetical protein